MIALLQTISMLLNLVWWVFLIMIIFSWLISFNVINTRNQFVATVWRILNQITEPILRPIRRIIPPVGGLDLSPGVAYKNLVFADSEANLSVPLYRIHPGEQALREGRTLRGCLKDRGMQVCGRLDFSHRLRLRGHLAQEREVTRIGGIRAQ